jgi:heme exporter protein A
VSAPPSDGPVPRGGDHQANGSDGSAARGDKREAIELDGLTRRWGEREALAGVTLTLPAGGTMVVLGSNGAGKTTLLRILASLLRPHEGEVRVLGSPLPRDAWAVRGRIGLLGHEPLLYRELTPRENLRFHARLHRVPLPRVDELLEAVGMKTRANEPLRTLSKGMVQRVAIARAVLHDPELLLLDEPRAGLDPGAAEQVEPLIGPSPDPARPRTRVLCSHDPEADLAGADLVLGLRDGRQALLGPPAAIDAAAIKALYL